MQGALLDLLVAIQRGPGLDRPVVANIVDRYFTSVTDAIEAGPDPAQRQQVPALLAHFTRSFTALALHHLDEHEVEAWVSRILTTLDVGAVASRSKRHLASMLTAVVGRYPLIVPKLEQLWALTSDANKHSIAECFAFVESGSMGLRSLALARRPDCPSDVANYIHSKFGG